MIAGDTGARRLLPAPEAAMTETPSFPTRRDRAPGFLWAFAAGPGGAAERLAVEDLPRAIEERPWVWLHVDLLDQRARGWIQGVCRLPTEVTTLIAGQDTGLALEPEGAEIHGIAPDYNVDFLRVSDSVGQFGFVASERLLVTGWRHPLAGVDAVRNALLAGARQSSGFSILAAITTAFTRVAIGRLRAAETRLDRVEDQILASSTADERTSIKEVRRLALALHRPVLAMLLLLREAEGEEEAEALRLAALPAQGLAAIEDMTTRLAALDHAIRATADRAKLLQEEIAAELADQSNRSLRALTVMTALMLPGTLVVGFFGMNTSGMPFEGPPWGTLAALGVGIILTIVFYRIMARAGATLRF